MQLGALHASLHLKSVEVGAINDWRAQFLRGEETPLKYRLLSSGVLYCTASRFLSFNEKNKFYPIFKTIKYRQLR